MIENSKKRSSWNMFIIDAPTPHCPHLHRARVHAAPACTNGYSLCVGGSDPVVDTTNAAIDTDLSTTNTGTVDMNTANMDTTSGHPKRLATSNDSAPPYKYARVNNNNSMATSVASSASITSASLVSDDNVKPSYKADELPPRKCIKVDRRRSAGISFISSSL